MSKRGEVRKVSCDADAWALIESWFRNEELGEVEFEGWPILEIKINGDDYQASLNSGQMAALVELKMVLGRAYSLLAHGAYDMRRLRGEEEESLQFTTKVKRGSSILGTDFTPLVQAFGHAITAHPSFALAAATVLGLAFVARPVIMKYYEDRAKQLEVGERMRLLDLSMNAQEKKQYRLFEKVIEKLESKHPQFGQVLPDARETFWKFASASVDADRMNIAGLDLTQDDLEILAERRRRRQGDVQEIEDSFKVVSVRKAGVSFKVGLESRAIAISALYRKPQLSDLRIKRLMSCMTSESWVQAKLQVRTVDQAQLSGRLISFRVISDDL